MLFSLRIKQEIYLKGVVIIDSKLEIQDQSNNPCTNTYFLDKGFHSNLNLCFQFTKVVFNIDICYLVGAKALS